MLLLFYADCIYKLLVICELHCICVLVFGDSPGVAPVTYAFFFPTVNYL